ncbi:PKD domain-containing protein, partial [Patescibacteria group bacterium]|nr:PKD domain-containing protein [Patescibacteria group bacterium]
GNSLQKIDGQWKVGSPTPGAQNSASTSDVDVPAQQQSTTVVDWPTEPQIYANAGEDRNAVAGADIKFSGRALGLQKEPLENARYLWSFGDGAGAESQNVLHTYHYPGDYIVVLNVSSGKYSASDRLLVKVLENNLKIIEANENYIKLHNGSKFDLDISSWFLRANSKLFKFPESTLIKSSADLSIPSSISGINVNNNQTVDLLYPNASIAYSYSPTPNIEYPVSNIAVAEPKPTTVVDSSPEVKDAGNSASDNEENTQQTASVISVGQNNSWGLKKWLAIILGIGIIAGAGLLIIRRQSSV